jgi:oligopeptide/dipeptide ABC transporter ATP-binding protein
VASTEGSFDVVRDVSFDINANEVLCLVGESGCGKTITALSIMRLLPTPPVRITSGEIVFDGTDLTELPERRVRDIRSERISMIFQDPLTSLDPVFTVGQVMTEVIRTHRDVNKAEAREMSVGILTAVGLPAPGERFDSYPHELSGGMRQRVMIATALVLDPEILIADEPTTALDVTVQAQILERLRSEQQDRHMAMLLITHDLAVVASIADRVAVMYAGEIVEEAPVDELFSNPRHPYTQGLLRALPHVSRKRRELVPIAGLVPPAQMMPPGCRFAPRCPHALTQCWDEHPAYEIHGGVGLRCFNPQPF